jgi:hypothetical protein
MLGDMVVNGEDGEEELEAAARGGGEWLSNVDTGDVETGWTALRGVWWAKLERCSGCVFSDFSMDAKGKPEVSRGRVLMTILSGWSVPTLIEAPLKLGEMFSSERIKSVLLLLDSYTRENDMSVIPQANRRCASK